MYKLCTHTCGQLLVAAVALMGMTEATCHADNCYRAMFPCKSASALSIASAFCATVTKGGTTATNYPTRATSACGSTPDRYVSACGCGPTCTSTLAPTSTRTSTSCPTPTGGNVVPNGDFECGLPPWTVQVPDTSATYSITSPGNTGSNAFEVDLIAPPATPQLGVNARIISPALAVIPNTKYRLTFWANFNDLQCGFIGVQINDQPIFTVDATDHGAASIGTWTVNSVDFTSATAAVTIKLEYLLGPALCHVKTDTISFVPVA